MGELKFKVVLMPAGVVPPTWPLTCLSQVILYSFYKNIVLSFTLFYFCFYTGFSGQVTSPPPLFLPALLLRFTAIWPVPRLTLRFNMTGKRE